MLKKINNLILRNLMNDPNKKFVSKDTGNKSSLKKSLSMFSTGITVVTTVDRNKLFQALCHVVYKIKILKLFII